MSIQSAFHVGQHVHAMGFFSEEFPSYMAWVEVTKILSSDKVEVFWATENRTMVCDVVRQADGESVLEF